MAKVSNPSYTSPKLELRPCHEKGGYGVFAREPIEKDELLSVWGGEVLTEEQLALEPVERQTHGIQVEEKVYLLPLVQGDPGDYFNHSCDPNAGLSGQICLIAMREIAAGEEICFDYAMSDSSDYDEFECHCGAASCRRRVTGNDWKLPELHERYRGYFIPYLQRRIDKLKKVQVKGSDQAHSAQSVKVKTA
jgi:SET domain-containing protein